MGRLLPASQAGALLAAALLVGATPTALPAQQPVVTANAQRGPILATKAGLTLPAGEFTVVDLIDAVAGYLCRNYLYDASELAEVRGFSLQRAIALDALGSEEMLYALLAARNLAALPIDEWRGVYQVVALTPERRTAPIATVPWRTPEEILRRPRLRELVLTSVVLAHADANQLANGLRAQFSFQGTWQPGMPTAVATGANTLLLHGYREQVAATLLFLQLVDRQSTPAAVPAPAPNDRLAARVDA
ncbi:MAG: hypothetical protein WAT39_07615, partial [Planctomycetota bacterium]